MDDDSIKRSSVAWEPVAAAACFIGSVLSVGTGFVLTTGWLLDAVVHPLLHAVGLFLLIAGIPILILGGHFMDLREKRLNQSGTANNVTKVVHLLLGSIALLSVLSIIAVNTNAQQINSAARPATGEVLSDSSEREHLLLRIEQLEKRLAALESRTQRSDSAELVVKDTSAPISPAPAKPASEEPNDFLRDTTFNVTLDGYYGYNFNRPVGGINLLRAYDVQSNSFSLNQAALIIENAPNLERGKRYGVRLDLQYGQATETVQGNAVNEPRPQVYRNLWQAYRTYMFDAGKGLTVDFGKFGSALGYETNYTKDNFNYSRSYFFSFLPFYHFGFRRPGVLRKEQNTATLGLVWWFGRKTGTW